VPEEAQSPGTDENLHAATVRRLRRTSGRTRRESLVPEVQNTRFPIVFRGYDREAVHVFLRELAAQVAELETTRSSDAVIKSALDEVGEQTSAILQQAHQSADEITRRSRAKADDRLRRAEGEAEIVVREAESRVQELDADAERIWQERQRLIEDLRQLAEEILRVADDALERFEPHAGDERTAGASSSDAQEPPQGDTAAERRNGDAGDHQHDDQ
jgi:DivIVA domain-containing protein